jgi:CheY-like chemotaxis protein
MQPPKVLLLENVAAQAAAARNVLVSSGCRLVISRFEADGRKKVREWSPDVIFLADTYPGGSLTSFCRQLRDDTSRPFRLILASSHTRERLSREEPDLELFVDGFVMRPFDPEEIREAIGGFAEKARSGLPESAEEKQRSLRGTALLVLDRDAELHRVLREQLAPKGVELHFVDWEMAMGAAPRLRPGVIILGWPLPDGFSIEDFKKILGGGGGSRPSVLLLSSSAREVVQAKSPAILRVTNMLFTKPVAWKHFFRFLEQSLEKAPAREAPRPQGEADEGGLRRRFQEELEAKFLEVEQLKRSLREAEKGGTAGEGGAAVDALREENRELREEIEKTRRRSDIELAKLRLRETDLEVKLGNLIRKKIDAERRAQDLIDEGTSRSDEMQRALEEAIGELQMMQEEQAAVKADLEQSTIDKEKLEEQLHVLVADMEKEKKSLLEEKEGARERAAAREVEVSGLEERLRVLEEQLAGRDEEIAEERRRVSGNEAELERLRGIIAAEGERESERSARIDSLEEDLRAKSNALSALEEELESGRNAVTALEKRLDEKENVRLGLEESLKASEEAVAGLDAELSDLRSRLNEAEGELKEKGSVLAALENGLEAKEAGLVEVEEKLRVSEEAVAGLDGELSELRCRLTGAEEKAAGREAWAEDLAREKEEWAGETARREEELRDLRSLVEESEAALVDERRLSSEARAELERLQAAVAAAEEEEIAQRGRIADLEGELESRAAVVESLGKELEERAVALTLLEEKVKAGEEAAAALGAELDDRRHRMAETEAALADLTAREAVLAREKEERVGERDHRERELQEWKQRAEVAEAVGREHDRVKNLLEEVVSRAQSEVIDRTRKEVELQEKLKTSLEEKKFILARLERELAGASEREMRLTALLESAVNSARGGDEAAAVPDNLPVAVPERKARPGGLLRPAAVAVLAVLLVGGGAWLATRSTPPTSPAVEDGGEAPSPAPHAEEGSDDPRAIWEEWTRRDVSGGVILQATLRSEAEIAAEVEAERSANGWSRERAAEELRRLLEPYRFNEYIYFYLHLKNMEPGYPGYAEEITDHLLLRDGKGNEATGFLPPDMEKYRRVYSFTAGELSERDDLTYEVAVPVAFSRQNLSPDPAYLELLAFNIGSSSRKVLTWELQ